MEKLFSNVGQAFGDRRMSISSFHFEKQIFLFVNPDQHYSRGQCAKCWVVETNELNIQRLQDNLIRVESISVT